ncbi:hypothetical protein [Streptomyces albogriseolus]
MSVDLVGGPDSLTTDWPEAWKHLNGWKRWLTVSGAARPSS